MTLLRLPRLDLVEGQASVQGHPSQQIGQRDNPLATYHLMNNHQLLANRTTRVKHTTRKASCPKKRITPLATSLSNFSNNLVNLDTSHVHSREIFPTADVRDPTLILSVTCLTRISTMGVHP